MTGTFTPEEVADLVAVRRDLHQHPETAYQEVRTSGVVAERLRSLGLEVRTGVAGTGVIATVKGGSPGRTVMLRADMDALPIQEENEVPYRSRHDGAMHACGHDCHTSILLAVARKLVREAPTLRGDVRLCFQPAEEIGGGAEKMIAEGAIDPPPDAIFGLHVWQGMPVGTIGVTPGPFMAAVDEFRVTIRGLGTHAAIPHAGRDSVVCLAHVITAIQTLASREIDPLHAVVVSVTQLRAGSSFNILPNDAWMNGTVRTFDRGVWQELPGRFERVVRGVAQALGCEADIEYLRYNQPTVNDPAMAAFARETAVDLVGADHVIDGFQTMGGEDFASFLARVPGCFVFVGSRNESRGLVHHHHTPRFDVDESCLPIGAELLLRLARRFLERA
jgi:amidohydrolase